MRVLLDGTWAFQWEKCKSGVSLREVEPGGPWRKARVPGGIHLDLLRHGRICEPLTRQGIRDAKRFEDRIWFYRKIFTVQAPDAARTRCRLVFEGLDGLAEVFLNGVHIGHSENAFVPHVFEVSGQVRTGRNTLLVKISNGLETVAGKDVAVYAGAEPGGERVWLRKPQFSFGWDWAPRLITCGLWRGVCLEHTEIGYLDDIHVRATPDRSLKNARIRTSFVYTPAGLKRLPGILRIRRGNTVVCEKKIHVTPGSNTHAFAIRNPDLWFPAGEGPQPLYDFDIFLPGTDLEKNVRFGVRSIRLEEKPLRAGGKTFALTVNGRKIFARGANWVPADSVIGRVSDEKTETLLREAAACHFNILRVWGGGVYESDRFYDLCDELGLLVWQDFMYACVMYPDDDEAFFQNAVQEAAKAIVRLRNHPCIAVWCGNNEIHDAYQDIYALRTPRLYGSRLWDEAFPRLVRAWSPGSLYRPASPYGGAFHRSDQEGDSHSLFAGLTREERTDIRHGAAGIGRMMTEFYCWNSPPSVASLKKYLPAGERSVRSPAYRFHTNTMYEGRERAVVQRYIAGTPEALPIRLYVGALQRLHGEHLARMVDAYRRNSRICSGALFWMYNDCWPTSGWTTHDYYLRRKALYYYMKRAFAPLAVSLKPEEGGLSVWISNLTGKAFAGTLEYGVYSFRDGAPRIAFRARVKAAAHSAVRTGFFHATLTWPWETLSSFARAVLRDGRGNAVARAVRMFSSYKGLSGREFRFPPELWAHKSLQPPHLRIRRQGKKILRVRTDVPAFGVELEADPALPDDNYFDLMPDEEKTVSFERNLPRIPPVYSLNKIILSLRKPGVVRIARTRCNT